MPDEIKKYIDHIKLDNGEKYWVEDAEALKASGGVITGDLEVEGTTTLDDDVTITGDTIISGSITGAGETSLTGNVLVVGDSTLVGNVAIEEDLTVTGDTSFTGDVSIEGNQTVGGNVSVAGNIEAANIAGGTTSQVLTKNSDTDFDFGWVTPITDYNDLTNKPQINSVTLQGNKSLHDLDIQQEVKFVDITTDSGTIESSDLTTLLNSDLNIIRNTTTGNEFKLVKKDNGTYLYTSSKVIKSSTPTRNSNTSNICDPAQIRMSYQDIHAEYDITTNSIHFYGQHATSCYAVIGNFNTGLSKRTIYFTAIGIPSSGVQVKSSYKQNGSIYDGPLHSEDFTESFSNSTAGGFYIYLEANTTYDFYLKLQVSTISSTYVPYYVINITDESDYNLELNTVTGEYLINEYPVQVKVTAQGMLKGTGTEVVAAIAGTDYIAPGDERILPDNGAVGQRLEVTQAKDASHDMQTAWVDNEYDDLLNRPQVNSVTLTGNKSLHDLDIQREIKYVELSDGQGTLTQEQHDTLFTQRGYACIVYTDNDGQSILERSGVRGTTFYWSATEIVGNQILSKEVDVNFTTDAWEYSVQEVEEKIDLIEINTSTLPATLSQTVYNTLISSKLNKLVDIAQDNNHDRNRVYSYVDDYFDTDNSILYTNYGCTYLDGNTVKRSILVLNRSNRELAAPVEYYFTAGDNISISNNTISYAGIELISKTASDLQYTPLTQDEITKLVSGKAALQIPGNDSRSGVYYLISNNEFLKQITLAKFNINDYVKANQLTVSTLTYNKTTGAYIDGAVNVDSPLVIAANITKNRLTKFVDSGTQNATIVRAEPGTDYIAPGDTRLNPSGGTTGQVLKKNSNTDYDYSWSEVIPYITLTWTTSTSGTINSDDLAILKSHPLAYIQAVATDSTYIFRPQGKLTGTTSILYTQDTGNGTSTDFNLGLSYYYINGSSGAYVKTSGNLDLVKEKDFSTDNLAKFAANGYIVGATAGTDYIAPGDGRLIPPGGTVGQHLIKDSSANYDFSWQPDVVEIANLSSSVLTQDEIERLRNNAMLYVQSHDFYFNFSYEDSSNIYLYQVFFAENRPYLRQLGYNKTTGARSSYNEKTLVWADGFNSTSNLNKLLKTPAYDSDGTKVAYAVAGTDYIAPGDSRLIKSGGHAGEVMIKNSDTPYDYSWGELHALPAAGTTGQVLVKASNTDYDAAWETIYTYTQVHCTSATDTPLNIKWNDGVNDVTGTMTPAQADTAYGPKSVFLVPSSTAGTQAAGEYERSLDGNDIVYLLDVVNSTFIKTVTTEFDVEHTHPITPTITAISAKASETAVLNTQDTFVKSYPGQSSKMLVTTITGTNGTQSVSKVTKTDGHAAILTESVATNRTVNNIELSTLSFSWTPDTPTVVNITDYNVALAAASATTVATGSLDENATGASVLIGLGNPTTATALTSSVIDTQPTIKLNGSTSINVVTNVTTTGAVQRN